MTEDTVYYPPEDFVEKLKMCETEDLRLVEVEVTESGYKARYILFTSSFPENSQNSSAAKKPSPFMNPDMNPDDEVILCQTLEDSH